MAFDGELLVAPNRKARTVLYGPVRDAARRTLIGAMTARGINLLDPTIVADEVARATLQELRAFERKRTGGQISPHTRQIIAMSVGDVLKFPPVAHQTAYSWMQTARKELQNPQAAWRLDTVETGIQLTRVADGEDVKRGPPLSALTRLMISLEPGGCATLPEKHRRGIEAHNKQTARKVLGEPTADWRSINTTKGLRVTRVA